MSLALSYIIDLIHVCAELFMSFPKPGPWLLDSDLRRLVSFPLSRKGFLSLLITEPFILELQLGILQRNLHWDKRNFVFAWLIVSSSYWTRIKRHNSTGPVSYPVTPILFKLHFICPCSISQMLYETKCYWIRRNILKKLKCVCRNWGSFQSGSIYKAQKYFSMLLSMETFPQSSWKSLSRLYIISFGLLSKTTVLVL